MNSSTAIKRALPILIVILVIIVAAVSCSVLTKGKPVPMIPNEKHIYLSLDEEGRPFEITNETMYNLLKKNTGLNVLIDKVDRDILSGLYDEKDNYWDLITGEEIAEALEKAMFPEGKDNLTAEEIEKIETEYYEDMYTGYGLKTAAEVNDYHRLILAKKLYAEDRLKDIIRMDDEAAAADPKKDPFFSNDDIETYFKANYESNFGFWTIIVPFNTKDEGTNALKQLGYDIHTKDPDNADDFDRWVKTVDGEEVALTPIEVIIAFIDMYNTVYSHRLSGYPTDTLSLTKNKQYAIVQKEGYEAVDFNVAISEEDEDLNALYFSYEAISGYQKEIQRYLSTTMKSYDTDIETVGNKPNWFTVNLRSYNNNTLYCYILKIAEEGAPVLEDVRDEIKEKLFEQEITDQFIAQEMFKLRKRRNLVIYDPEIEKSYIELGMSYDEIVDKTKGKSKTLVAQVGDVEYSAEQLFNLMDKKYGISIALSEIYRLRLLNNPAFNKIFDYYLADAKSSKRIIDPEKWKTLKERAIREKQQFIAGAYAQYGYDAQYGWKNFIRDIYGVNNDEELLYYFLYSQIVSDYAASLGDIADLTVDSEEWQAIETQMQKQADDYFKVTGVHLLIKVEDKDGNPVNSDKWTDVQVEYAKELYRQIWNYYNNEVGTSQEKFEAIANAFNESLRFVAKLPQNEAEQPRVDDAEYTFKDIEVAKFKTAGLSVKYESLGEFTNGNMVKPFDDAVRSIWKANPSSDFHIPYGSTPDNEGEWNYLVTEFGYHAYVNTSSTDIEKWDEENGYIIPTLAMIKTQIKDSSSPFIIDEEGELTETEYTDSMKAAIATYFNPIKAELTGNDYTSIQLYNQIKADDFAISLNNENYTRDDFIQFLDYRIKKMYSKLTYFGDEEEK